jgi:hypothetical protein
VGKLRGHRPRSWVKGVFRCSPLCSKMAQYSGAAPARQGALFTQEFQPYRRMNAMMAGLAKTRRVEVPPCQLAGRPRLGRPEVRKVNL